MKTGSPRGLPSRDTDDTQPYDVLSASPLYPSVVVGAEPKVLISAAAERERFQKKIPHGEDAEGAPVETTITSGDAWEPA